MSGVMRIVGRVLIVTMAILTIPALALAEGGTSTFYAGTSMSFNYAGTINGTFDANGVVKSMETFPPVGTSAAVGMLIVEKDPEVLGVWGAIDNQDGTYDWATITFVQPDIATGTYPIGEGIQDAVGFMFFDNADEVGGPEGGGQGGNWGADHAFMAISGQATIDNMNGTISGTFTGQMMDLVQIGGMISVGTGVYNLTDPMVVPVLETSWGRIKALY